MIEERFRSNFTEGEPDECWMWEGSTNASQGYGVYGFRKKGAHRIAWELANGQEIPPGMFVLHSCDTRVCVNPAHLRLGTPADNMADVRERKRMPGSRLTHCVNGHPFDEVNTYWRPQHPTRRDCRACARERRQRREAA